MRTTYRRFMVGMAVAGLAACADPMTEESTADPDRKPIQMTMGPCGEPDSPSYPEGELFGTVYNGSTLYCLPHQDPDANTYHLEVTGSGVEDGIFHLVHFEANGFNLDGLYQFHWNDPSAVDVDGCTPGDPPSHIWYAERHHGGNSSPGDGREKHCIQPGVYAVTLKQGTTVVQSVLLDYVHHSPALSIPYDSIRPGASPGGGVSLADESFAASGYTPTDHMIHFNVGTPPSAGSVTEAFQADAPGTFRGRSWYPLVNTNLVVSPTEPLRVNVGATTVTGLSQGSNAVLHRITWEPGVSTNWYWGGSYGGHTRAHTYGGSARCVTLTHEVALPQDITASGVVVPSSRKYTRTVDVGGACAGRTHPDLIAQAIAPVGTLPSTGSGTVNVTVANTGTGPSQSGTVKLYLSTTATFPASPVYLGSASYSGIAASGNQVVPVSVSLTAAGNGTRYIFAEVDDARESSELSEGNNRSSAMTTIGDLPDLRVTRVLNPLNRMIGAGSAAYVEVHFKNFGTGTAPLGWFGSVALSTDTIYGAGDVVLGTFSPAGALQPYGQMGDSGLQAFYFSAPVGTTPGQYYLVAKVDSTNVITESNEGNNTGPGTVMSITANGFQPDVIVDSVTMPWGNSTDDPSQSLAWMRVWYRNAGNATAPAGYTIRGYLSTNTSCCTGDILAWSLVTGSSLAPGASATAGPKFTLPAPAAAYYFFGHVNAFPTYGLSEANQANDLKRTTGTFSVLY